MRKIGLFFVFVIVSTSGLCKFPSDDIVLRAMQDEITRNTQKLQMGNFETPYFIAYTLKDIEQYHLASTLGSKIDDLYLKMRFGAIDIRVGNYNFDNSNFGNLNIIVTPFATEDNYDAIRNTFWIYTDLAYKRALEKFADKKAYKERKNITEHLDDFSKVKPKIWIDDLAKPELDRKLWTENLRKISAVFKKYPGIKNSLVGLSFYVINKRYSNSEGSAYRYAKGVYAFDFTAQAQASDGLLLDDGKSFIYHYQDEIPSVEYFVSQAEKFAKKLVLLSKAPMGEVYIGPVIFRRQAAGKFFELLLAKNLNNTRQIWTESDRDVFVGQFYDRLNTRIMSNIFDVYDDPRIKSIGKKYMLGHYMLDDEAVPSQKVKLIEKGKLTDLLISRSPTKKLKLSNGHGRGFYTLPRAHVSNLIIEANKTSPDLEQRLIERCKELGLDYGLIISGLDSFSDTFYAYKLFTDGTKQLVRGLEFNDISTRALRDISAASAKVNFHHTDPTNVPVSIVAPDILVEEIEIRKTQKKPQKFPVLKHPFMK